ncbi:MAG: SMP-30/gluconolactonase/LRE family protein [Nocardioidaceae bacterium]|nr:SMP-30/gluconolactonase/LRE family protein [Nocardioidaceae bacterium]MCL2614250.1 SMP-30/gluconolactonase/LRE family protein [Nocardioidaceae bacterium]
MASPEPLHLSDPDCVLRSRATCGESPMWSTAEGVLYWTDNVGRCVHRFDPRTGRDEEIRLDEDVMDVVVRRDGGLLVVTAKAFARLEPASGGLRPFAEVERDRPDNRFNDGKVDRRGRYWAGSMDGRHWDRPGGALYRLDQDGAPVLVRDGVVCANGLGWSPDDRTFYLGESFRHAIFAYDFDADDGAISNRRLFVEVGEPGGAFPDGLTVDAEGGVWSVHNAGGKVVRYDADGTATHVIELPVPHPTSCIFGGRDLTTLYITTARQGMREAQISRHPLSGSVFAIDPGIGGLPEPLFTG